MKQNSIIQEAQQAVEEAKQLRHKAEVALVAWCLELQRQNEVLREWKEAQE